jgi:hypothetical protein
MVEIFRQMTPARKLSQAFGMWETAIKIMKAGIRYDHPNWSAAEVHREILRRMGRSVPHE